MADPKQALLPILQGYTGTYFAWDESTPVCSWYGVSCDSTGSVTTLSLAGAEPPLSGTIPKSIGRIITLTEIYLHSNKLNGSVPREVSSLPQLRSIDLSYNELTGTIPIFTSSSLESISLGHNQFSGKLNPDIGKNLNSLKIFDVQYNRLSGTIPSLTAPLRSLVEFDLSNNQLKGTIPGFLTQLPTLERLYLSNNRLSGTIPNLGKANPNLEEIYLHGNLISGTLPAALAELPELKILFVDGNKITGTVPSELCDQDLNEPFFHGSSSKNIDQTYTDLYGSAGAGRRVQRAPDPNERDGCTSIACPSGSKSTGNNKDGVFPCQVCQYESINPYIGSNKCFELNQEFILQTLFESTNGPTWKQGRETWADESVPACAKEGVTCNQNGMITSLALSGMGLSGTLPPDIGSLIHLEEVDVSNNQISGQLPIELRYTALQKLDISNNKMSGFVPMGLCQKAGINRNGLNGIYTCDTIACGMGYFSPNGRAEAGAGGMKCEFCDETQSYLGSTSCPTSSSGNRAFGFLILAFMAVALLLFVVWVRSRSKVSLEYINNREQGLPLPDPEEEPAPPHIQDMDDSIDPLAGIEGAEALPADIEVRVKDEWSSEKESTKEVWLDVPKIQ